MGASRGRRAGAAILPRVRPQQPGARGQELAIVLTTIGAELQLAPAGGAWPVGELTIEVQAGLAAVGGSALAAPLALPYTVL